MSTYADVILPLPFEAKFTYLITEEFESQIAVGMRIIVPLGEHRIMTGIVAKLHDEKPVNNWNIKPILEILDDYPIVDKLHVSFWEWIASYYAAPVGEVLNVALPSGMKLTSRSQMQLNPETDLDSVGTELSEDETRILDILKNRKTLAYDEAEKIIKKKNLYRTVKKLLRRELILVYDEVVEKYKPKKISKIRLHEKYANERGIRALQDLFRKKPRQTEALLKYLSLVPLEDLSARNHKGVSRKELLEGALPVKASAVSSMIKAEIFEAFTETVDRFQFEEHENTLALPRMQLSEAQSKALAEIYEQWTEKDIVLLHGLTGSGKTEIYIELIGRVLQSGTQVLMLLPEIALTTQIVGRMRKIFGKSMGVYHSRFSDDERVELWQAVRERKISFVIGVRSAIFLPFSDLGLVIIDEEHETAYKQFEKTPLYHGRDLALVLANFHKAKALLGSATPSVESYFLAQSGHYGLVKLHKRFGDAALPEIRLTDLRAARREKSMKGFFSSELLAAVSTALTKKEQVILFQNRRGYSPYMQCNDCSWVPKCVNCSVSLTYHQREISLKCHYCGHYQHVPDSCGACGSENVHVVGYGTERIEDELKIHFPDARISRMDKDTTSGKNDFERIIEDFENHENDILVGTQMITKGLDFAKVNLVGVFDIDRMLNFPDFRAEERVFQLLMQVSGRAGRKSGNGLVLIQTTNPEQKVFEFLVQNSYEAFYEREIGHRNQHFYPPFSRIIKISVKAEDFNLCDRIAHDIVRALKKNFTVLGPETGLVERIRNKFIQNILIKLPRAKFDLKSAKTQILQTINHFRKLPDAKKVQIVVDVDPI